jgi:hypothetical protein|tara:strand:+ start:544 stop:735 length:192 start_codon:yes stop_codon:yes gene_type:complete
MQALKLIEYMKMKKYTASELSRHLGRSRQVVKDWIKAGAYVEITDAGVKITTTKVVHETQVKK